MFALMVRGTVHELFDKRPDFHEGIDVRDVSNIPGVQPGWIVDAKNNIVPDPALNLSAAQKMKARAADMLAQSDVTVLRCFEADVPLPEEWKSYRRALRDIIRTKDGETIRQLPKRPDFPAGT